MGERELDKSFQRLQMFDLDELEDVEACQERWIEEVMTTLKCDHDSELKMGNFMAPTGDDVQHEGDCGATEDGGAREPREDHSATERVIGLQERAVEESTICSAVDCTRHRSSRDAMLQ